MAKRRRSDRQNQQAHVEDPLLVWLRDRDLDDVHHFLMEYGYCTVEALTDEDSMDGLMLTSMGVPSRRQEPLLSAIAAECNSGCGGAGGVGGGPPTGDTKKVKCGRGKSGKSSKSGKGGKSGKSGKSGKGKRQCKHGRQKSRYVYL
jgi:hypothetical protein